MQVTDVVRMYMFEIMTQYRAIFLDYGSGGEGGSGGEASSAGADGGLLYAWANRRVLNFISFVDVNLGKIKEGSQVASILEKVMYCGAYLGREGLDFRAAIQEPFCERIAALLRSALNDSRQSFHQVTARFLSCLLRSPLKDSRQSLFAPGPRIPPLQHDA
jgi:hypothetical protein